MSADSLRSQPPIPAGSPAPESPPSVAIVYDKFLVQGGGERVCEILLEAFPEARLYALNARPRQFWEAKLGRPIHTPMLGALFVNRAMVTLLYPLAALLMARLRVRADVVIAYSSSCGKFAQLDCRRSILYSNYPNRGIYQLEKVVRSRVLRAIMKPVVAVMARYERAAIRKYDLRISISQASRAAMLDFSGMDTDVLMPPFNERGLSRAIAASPSSSRRAHPYFVLISRLEPEKDIEYVIHAFRKSGRELRVIGTGSLRAKYEALGAQNIRFLGYLEDCDMAVELAGAEALVFPSAIEYSLVPLEANYLGVPVIALDTPAMQEVLIEWRAEADGANAVFFNRGTIEDLAQALATFDAIRWNRDAIRQNAARFNRTAFTARLHEIIAGADDQVGVAFE